MKRILIAFLLLGLVSVWAADELSLSVGWTYDKNSRKRILSPTTTKHTITGNYIVDGVQNVATSATAITLGAVTNAGWAYFKNLGPSNYVELGCMDVNTNFVAFARLATNEVAVLWLGTLAPYGKANAAAVKLDYAISDR